MSKNEKMKKEEGETPSANEICCRVREEEYGNRLIDDGQRIVSGLTISHTLENDLDLVLEYASGLQSARERVVRRIRYLDQIPQILLPKVEFVLNQRF